jgi:hypothetical protein
MYDPMSYGPADPIPSHKVLRHEFHRAREAGAEIVYLHGAKGFEHVAETMTQIQYLGYSSVMEYLADACILAMEKTGPGGKKLRPVLNVGHLTVHDLSGLAEVVDHFRFNIDLVEIRPPDLPPVGSIGYDPVSATANQLADLGHIGSRIVVGMKVGMGENTETYDHLLHLLAVFAERSGQLKAISIKPLPTYPSGPLAGFDLIPSKTYFQYLEMARNIMPESVEIWVQPQGRADILNEFRESEYQHAGMISLNTRLPNGQLIGDWFESEIGPINLFKHKKKDSENAQVGSAGSSDQLSAPSASAKNVVENRSTEWKITTDGLLSDGKALWVPDCQTGPWPAKISV